MARTGGLGDESTSRLVGALVSSPQRRTVVWHLTGTGGSAGFDNLVDVLVGDTERTMTAIRLHHIHLPKLQAAGAVEWDEETGDVQLTPQAREVVGGVARNELFPRLARDGHMSPSPSTSELS